MRLHAPHRCMKPHRTRAGPGTRLSRAGPAGLLRARVGVEALELVGIDAAHDPRGEQALEEPADPPAPCQVVEIRTREPAPSGVTVHVVTRLEPVSDSTMTRPGCGSVTSIRYSRLRPPAVTLKRVIVPAPTPPDSISKSV